MTPEDYERIQQHYEEARAKGFGGAVRMSSVLEERLVWWWPDALARGIVTLLAGDGGMGKSTVAMALGSMVTRGEAPPGGAPFERPRGLVIISAEESASLTIAPRLRAMGADPERVLMLDPHADPVEFGTGTDGAVRLEKMVAGIDAGMVVLDTGADLFADTRAHEARGEIGQFFRDLGAVAGRFDCMVLVLHHFKKGATEDKTVRSKIYGNGAWTNKPRMAGVVMTPEGAKPTETTERVLGFGVKSNISRRSVGARVAFSPVPGYPGITTCSVGPLDDDDLDRHLSARLDDDTQPTATKTEQVRDLLDAWLADSPMLASDCEEALAEQGYGDYAVQQGKKAARVTSRRSGGVWWWCRSGQEPPHEALECPACHAPVPVRGVCAACLESSGD